MVRLINEMVDLLYTRTIENSYEVTSDTGRPPFHPKTFLKVALFALHSCRFSLRKIEEDTINNLAYKWLTGDMRICKEQNLMKFDLLAVDSIKVRANANYKQSKTLEGINKEEHRIKERLEEILDTAADAESAEAEEVLALSRRSQRVREARKYYSRA